MEKDDMGCNLIHCKFATMTIDEANRQFISSLGSIYDEREASSITSLVMENLTGMSKSLRVIHKQDALPQALILRVRQYLNELMQHRPVQYVLGEAWFAGLRFYVDENVLIPRPETEELLDWILADLPSAVPSDFKILDIGTGSGCIPVSLGKKRPDIQPLACDISLPALDIARRNSAAHGVPVAFSACDIRDEDSWGKWPSLDLMVSNPPYIPEMQKARMDRHVKNFEPGLALFVPDEDPILFYKAIGNFSKKKLLKGGKLFLEIHHDFSKEIRQWYGEHGFSTELRQDFSGKNRMLKAQF
jgi:release factor glutamine methyltransferase